MKLWSETVPGLRLAYDNTTLSKFVECPRKYQLAMVLNLKPNRPSVILAYGTAIHAILEYYDKRRNQLSADKLDPNNETAAWELAHLPNEMVAWGLHYVHTHYPELVKSDDSKRNIYTLFRVVLWYVAHYCASSLVPMRLPNGDAALELSFSFELPFTSPSGEPYIYCGHLDGLFENQNRVPVVLDRKTTTSAIHDKFFERYRNSSQMVGYAIGAHLNFDINVKGVIIDAISVSVNGAEFSRQEVPVTPARGEEFLHDMSYWLDFLTRCTVDNYFPMNRNSCGNYGGCEYLDLCKRCPSNRSKFIEGEYVESPVWNPLESR